MLSVTPRAPLNRSSRRAAGDSLSRVQRTAIPGARTFPRASGLETSRFRAQSTFRRVRSSHRLRGDCYVACVRGVPSRLPRTYPFAFSPQRSAFPRSAVSFWLDTLLVRALASPHPSDVEILPTDVCHPILLFQLHPCSRRSNWLSDSHPFHSRGCSVHAVQPASAGPARSLDELFAHRSRGDLRLFASPVAIPVLVLRPLSRTPAILNRRGHFCESRRDALPAFVTRDAFRQSRFERLPPCGVGRPLRDARLDPGGLRGYAPRSDRRFPFAFAARARLSARARCFPRG
jgi:hypothetical protein